MASSNVELLYPHPHITLYLEDNTIQAEESSVESDSGLYGIQVGAFEGGRDNVVLRYTSTEQMVSELGECNYEVYGQAGYNAYNALNSKACGMYIMRCMPDDAPYANKVIMARFKVANVDGENTDAIDHVDNSMSLAEGKNAFSDLGSSEMGKFALYGTVNSGLTGDSEIDAMFATLTPQWVADNNLPKFTIATFRIFVPDGVEPGATIKIIHTSGALKTYYGDFNNDPDHIVVSGNTATKTKDYNKDDVFPDGGISFDFSAIAMENDTINFVIEWNDAANTVSNYTISTANVEYVEPVGAADGTIGEGGATEEKAPCLDISYYAISFEGITSIDELLIKFSSLFSENVDQEGYYNMPVFLFYALGRGSYGNNLRLSITDGMAYEGDPIPFRRYCITVMQLTKTGLKAKEYIRGSINETAWDTSQFADGTAAYLQDLANDIEYGSNKINMQVAEQTFEKMLDLYNEYLVGDEDEPMDMNEFDPLLGLDMNGEANPNILIGSYQGNKGTAVNMEAIDGFSLENGSDGSMTYKAKMTAEEKASYDAAYEKALLRAFGDITEVDPETRKEIVYPIHDKSLRSRYTTPADFMFDANFPNTVKMKMVEFTKEYRKYDCMTYLDSGLCQTSTECISWLRSMKDFYGYNVVKDLGCFKYRDSRFTRKVIPMTVTHWLSANLPIHLSVYGLSTAFARKYARLKAGTDYIAGTFYPIIDPDDNATKKIIYNLRGNCYESYNRNTVQRSSAITTCQELSDRMEEFNEYIVHRAVRIAYDIMNSNIYNVIDDEKLLAYTEHAEKQISYNLEGLVERVKISMESSPADRKKSILRLVMRIEFHTVAKYGAVEIYLDPRGTYAAEIEAANMGY